MKRKIVATWLSLVMILVTIVILIDITQIVKAPTTWYVDDVPGEGPGNPAENFTSIQDAINAANDGDTVYVYNGSYYENVALNKMINLIGENMNNTLIDRKGNGADVYIFADWANITGFTISNSGAAGSDAGIDIDTANNITISNNNISSNDIGIYITSTSTNINIIGNIISSNGEDGIHLYTSNNNIIGNKIYQNGRAGLNFDSNGPYSNGNNIINNNISFNQYGMGFKNFNEGNIVNNEIISNTNTGLFLFSSSNNKMSNNTIFSNDIYGFYSSSSHYNILNDNRFLDNGYGIYLNSSDDWNIFNNTVMNNNWRGIYLRNSHNSTISGNEVSKNNGSGMEFWESIGNIIINNNISRNEDGIHLTTDCIENNIIKNNVSNNNHHGVYLYLDCTDNNIDSNHFYSNSWSGIYLVHFSNRNNITRNNVLSNKLSGIVIIDFCSENKVTGNIISSNNESGIHIELSNANNISKNEISSNNQNGIFIVVSSYWNNISSNTISHNFLGVSILSGCSNNNIYHNNFLNNTTQASDLTNDENQWDNGYPSGGNYWSDFDEPSEGAFDDYKGPNQNVTGSDGIVDNGTIGGGGINPYLIDSDSQDNYPLIKPFLYLILYQGWNLISIPLIQQERGLTKVLASIDGLYDAVQRYDISDTLDPWKHHKINKTFGNDLFQLNETMGFWLHIIPPGQTIFVYNGTSPTTNQTIPLQPGWNLVGYPSLTSYNRTVGLNNLTFITHVDAIWTYIASTQKWEKLGPSDYFVSGKGYWVHAKVECEWEVPL